MMLYDSFRGELNRSPENISKTDIPKQIKTKQIKQTKILNK